ncbi:MAG TPA: hypothetical protein VGD60_06955 [Candidatus Acidoferrales bacterium]
MWLRFMLLLGLLLLELGLVIAFLVLPLLHGQIYAPPNGHWGMETGTANSFGLHLGLIAFAGLFALGNVELILLIWRAFGNLKSR